MGPIKGARDFLFVGYSRDFLESSIDPCSRVDRRVDQGCSNLSPIRRGVLAVCLGELILHPYYIPERKTARRTSEPARRKIEVDGPRDPFVCGNGLPTRRERRRRRIRWSDGNDERAVPREEGPAAQGKEVREGGGGEKNERREHQGRVILAPRHVTPVVADSSGQLHEGATTGDEASSIAIKVRLVASTRPISLPRARTHSFLFPSRAKRTRGAISRFPPVTASHAACEKITSKTCCIKGIRV